MIGCLWMTSSAWTSCSISLNIMEANIYCDPSWSLVTLFIHLKGQGLTLPFTCWWRGYFISLAINLTVVLTEIPAPYVTSRLNFLSFYSGLMRFSYTKWQDKTFKDKRKSPGIADLYSKVNFPKFIILTFNQQADRMGIFLARGVISLKMYCLPIVIRSHIGIALRALSFVHK